MASINATNFAAALKVLYPSGLEELILAATSDAQARAKRQRIERLTQVTGGVQLPWFS